jgi:thioesterase domain-containing protein
VYALAAKGLLPGELPLDSIQQMAGTYLRAIRKVQPHGPYQVAGWSAGGTIAYEVARQLICEDQSVAFLGLVDSTSDYRRNAVDWADLKAYTVTTEADFVWEWTRRTNVNTLSPATPFDSTEVANVNRTDVDKEVVKRHLAVRNTTSRALWDYTHKPLPIDVHLFLADQPERVDATMGWKSLLGDRLNSVVVGGTHRTIVEEPYVERLGQKIEEALLKASNSDRRLPEHEYSPMVPIQRGRPDRTPAYFVPGAGASVTALLHLARSLDLDISMYGLQPRGLEGQLLPYGTVEAAAAAFVKVVKQTSLNGRCNLLGHSFGGWIAAEMALQLQDAGLTVDMLVLLDSPAPEETADTPVHKSRTDTLMPLLRNFELIVGSPLNLPRAELDALGEEAQLQLILSKLIAVKLLPPNTQVSALRGVVDVFHANLNTYYNPSRLYRGETMLVIAEEAVGDTLQRQELQQRWQRSLEQIEVVLSPGNHMSMLSQPHARTLADALRHRLG